MPRPLRRVGVGGWVKAGLQEKRIFLKLKKNPKKNVATKLARGMALVVGPLKKELFCGFPYCFIHLYNIYTLTGLHIEFSATNSSIDFIEASRVPFKLYLIFLTDFS